MRVILLGYGKRPGVLATVDRLRPEITKRATIVAEDFSGQQDMSSVDADFAIVLGGDGSILRAAHQMGKHQLPVVAVNLGKLGFLADICPSELAAVLDQLRSATLGYVEHLMFRCNVIRGNQVFIERLGLNEVCLLGGPPFSLLDINLYIDAEHVTTYSCDGLIISAPVGSTAHNLSAGGPILRKNLHAFVVSPISPHTLSHRPVVDSGDCVFEMELAPPRDEVSAYVVMDGIVLTELEPGERVRVEKASARFRLVVAPGHSYYRTLREKLGWSGQLPYARRTCDEGCGAHPLDIPRDPDAGST